MKQNNHSLIFLSIPPPATIPSSYRSDRWLSWYKEWHWGDTVKTNKAYSLPLFMYWAQLCAIYCAAPGGTTLSHNQPAAHSYKTRSLYRRQTKKKKHKNIHKWPAVINALRGRRGLALWVCHMAMWPRPELLKLSAQGPVVLSSLLRTDTSIQLVPRVTNHMSLIMPGLVFTLFNKIS